MTDVSVLHTSKSDKPESALQVNVADAIRFLQALDPRPEARFDLASIDPVESGLLHAKTFLGSELYGEGFARWVRQENRTRGVFCTPNEARAGTPRDKRLADADIGLIRANLADIDPTEKRSKQDALGELAVADAGPTMIVDSVNGLWPYWLPESPMTVESTDAVAQNRALVAAFDADSCTDLCHLARLPGTINWPNAGKKARGCVPGVSRIISDKGPRYTAGELAASYPPVIRRKTEAQDMAPAPGMDGAQAVADCLAMLDRDDAVAVAGGGGNNLTRNFLNFCMDRGVSPEMAAVLCAARLKTEGEDWTESALLKFARRLAAKRETPIGSKSAEGEFEDESTGAEYDPLHPPGLPQLRAVTTAAVAGIKAREWLVGKFLARGYLAALGAPPGSGKTQLLAKIAVAAASGRGDVLGPGFDLHERTRVFMWNQEDEEDEILRRCGAEMQYYGINDEDLLIDGKPGIVIGSGVEYPLLVSRPGADGMMADTKEAKRLTEHLVREGFGIAMFDPFAEMHAASEEADNVMIGRAGGAFRRIAINARVASLIATHTRKPSNASSESHAGSMDALRGASALAGVCRMIATLFEMDAKTAKEFGIPEEERNRYVRFDDAKANMSLKRSAPLFFKREGVRLPTSDGKTEEVGALLPRQMSKVEKSAKPGDTLVEDAKALLAGGGLWIGELAEQLMLLPMYSDSKEATIKQRVRRAFAPAGDSENAKNTNGVAWELRVKPGTRAREAWVELHE